MEGDAMMCCRDMTFCPFWEDCGKAKDCHRPFTTEVEAAAKAWWGGNEDGTPICVFGSKPPCHTDHAQQPK